MSSDSSVAGYLAPANSPAPLEDASFEDFLHDLFVGVSGMDPKLVRPRWQVEPPNQPTGDWMAFGITRIAPDTYAAVIHDAGGNGSDQLQRHETVEVLISSYGPNASKNLSLLRDGLQVEQNRAVLTQNGMGLEATGEMIPVPTLAKNQWLRRYDLLFTMRRQILRSYPVLSLLSSQGTINNQVETVPINVNAP